MLTVRRKWIWMSMISSVVTLTIIRTVTVPTPPEKDTGLRTVRDVQLILKYVDSKMLPSEDPNVRLHIDRTSGSYGNLWKFKKPERNLTDKYIIYRCTDRLCGGLADRQKGIITAYLISQMLRRKFGLYMKKGCDFAEYVKPNEVDWIVSNETLKGKSTDDKNTMQKLRFGADLSQIRLENLFSEDVTYFEGNIDFVPILMNLSSFSTVAWAKNERHYDILRIGFAHLFKLAPRTLSIYKQFVSKIKNNTLVCVHMRMGRSKTLQKDDDFSYKAPDNQTVFQFLKEKLTQSSKVFIATDSQDTSQEFKSTFPEAYIAIEGKILHVDQIGPDFDCAGVEKAILDQFILSTCDTLVISYSGFSIMAAILRGSDKNLYLAWRNRTIQITRIDPTYGVH